MQVDVFQETVMTTLQRIRGDATIPVGLIGRVAMLGKVGRWLRDLGGVGKF